MECKEVQFSRHAIERMFQRGFRPDHVRDTLANGEVIADYPDDKPFASRLLLYLIDGQPLHVVVASDPVEQTCIIVTVYQPDPSLWEPDFRTRRPR